MSRTVAALAAFGLLAACGPKTGDPEPGTQDIRVDGASADNDPDSHSMRMCANDDGYVFIAWIDDRDGTPDLWVNRSPDLGASWLPTPVKVNRGENNKVFAPTIACNNDSVFLVWEDDRDGELENHQIYYSRSVDGGESWLEQDVLLELDEDGFTMSLGPQIVAAGSDVHVAWYDSQNGAYDIFVASSLDGGQTFRAPVRVDSDDPGDAYSAAPRIAATAGGQVYVTWEDSRGDGGESDIYFARSDDNGRTFKKDVRLDLGDPGGAAASFAPRIGADGNDVYVVWHDARNGVGRDVYLNYSGNGGVDWRGEAVRVNGQQAGFFNSLYPAIAVEGGEAHIAWQDARDNDVYDIYYRRVVTGDPGADEVRVDTGDGPGVNNSVSARIARGSGAMVIAWEDYRGEAQSGTEEGYVDLHYNFDDGSGMQEEDYRIDSLPPGYSHKYDLAVAVHDGMVLSAWIDNRNLNDDVWFHALQLGSAASYAVEGEE